MSLEKVEMLDNRTAATYVRRCGEDRSGRASTESVRVQDSDLNQNP